MPPRPGNASTSSVERKLPVMATVAPVRFALSESATVMPPSMTVAPWFSVKERLPLRTTTGASLTAATLMVLVGGGTTVAETASVTLQLIVRDAVEGLFDVLAY